MLWNLTKAGALHSAMKLIDREVDPDLLLKRADEMGIKLPITSAVNVSAASLPGGGIARLAFKVDTLDIYKLRDAIDTIMTRKAA